MSSNSSGSSISSASVRPAMATSGGSAAQCRRRRCSAPPPPLAPADRLRRPVRVQCRLQRKRKLCRSAGLLLRRRGKDYKNEVIPPSAALLSIDLHTLSIEACNEKTNAPPRPSGWNPLPHGRTSMALVPWAPVACRRDWPALIIVKLGCYRPPTSALLNQSLETGALRGDSRSATCQRTIATCPGTTVATGNE